MDKAFTSGLFSLKKWLRMKNICILENIGAGLLRFPMNHLPNPSANHRAILREARPPGCSRLIPKHCFGIDYFTFFSVMFYLSPAEWLCTVREGFASELKSFSAGAESRAVKRLFHFCTPLITFTFWPCIVSRQLAPRKAHGDASCKTDSHLHSHMTLAFKWRANSWKENGWLLCAAPAQTGLMSVSY